MTGNPTKPDGAASKPLPGAVDHAAFLGREAVPTGEMVALSPEQVKARRRRSQWIALALFTFVILVFVITVTKLGANVMVRDL